MNGHVVQVVQSIDRGGLEMMAVDLAIALRQRGFMSSVVALDEGGRLEARLRSASVNLEVIRGVRYWSPQSHVKVRGVLAQLRPTVVHTHHLPALLNVGPAARTLGVPRTIHTEHAHLYLDDSPRMRRLLRLGSRMADAVVLVGSALEQYYLGTVKLPASRLHIVPNGIDTDRFAPLPDTLVATRRRAAGVPDSSLLVGAIGRLAPEKNYGLLLRAAAAARARGVDLTIALVGDGEERASLEELARELGIGDHILFLGWRTDVSDLVGMFDALAVTSTSEALPLVILEAMGAGVPVVSTSVGEIPRVLGDGEAGLLIASGDERGLADVLVRLAEDPALRASLGSRGRARAQLEYSQATMVDRYVALYQSGRASST